MSWSFPTGSKMYKRVTSIVISFHLLFITLLLFNPHKIPVKRNNHVKVRTVRPMATVNPVTSRPAVKKSATPTPKATPAPATKTTTKKTTTPTANAKKPAAKTTNKPAVIEKGKPVKKSPPKKPEPTEEIWNEIDQALAKIEKKSYPISKHSLDLPKPLIFVEEFVAQDVTAIEQLMGFLHETLHLPDIGEVKIEISVRKNGSVAKVVVLSSESKKNKEYLQKHLPLLQFPMQFEDEKNIIITFCNEV